MYAYSLKNNFIKIWWAFLILWFNQFMINQTWKIFMPINFFKLLIAFKLNIQLFILNLLQSMSFLVGACSLPLLCHSPGQARSRLWQGACSAPQSGNPFLQQRFYNTPKIPAFLWLKFNYFLTGLPPNWSPTLLTIWVGYNFLIVLKNQQYIMVDACAIKNYITKYYG